MYSMCEAYVMYVSKQLSVSLASKAEGSILRLPEKEAHTVQYLELVCNSS